MHIDDSWIAGPGAYGALLWPPSPSRPTPPSSGAGSRFEVLLLTFYFAASRLLVYPQTVSSKVPVAI